MKAHSLQCPNCGKTGRVTIGDKDYCTNCGSIINSSQPEAPVAPAVADAVPPAPAPEPAPVPAPAPAPVPDPTPAPEPAPDPTQATVNPANAFHGAPTGNVLDLRNATPVPVPPEEKATEPVPAEVPVPAPEPDPVEAAMPVSVPVGSSPAAGRAERAAEVAKSDLITRFPRRDLGQAVASPSEATAEPEPAPEPIPAAEPSPVAPEPTMPEPVPAAESAPIPVSVSAPTPMPAPEPAPAPLPEPVPAAAASSGGSIDGLAPAAFPTPATTPQAIPTTPMPGPDLPAAVATQVDALAKMAQSQADEAQALPAGPKPASVAALALAVALLGGYIWLKNYPNMALRVAANKAGVEAALPAYLPSSYNLDGPISYAPGQVSVKFTAPGGEPMIITQKRTNWDSQSLLENYVLKVTDKYLRVDSQGLTIYFYDNNQATWVNRGVWYALEGDTRLSREQLLKIIDSL